MLNYNVDVIYWCMGERGELFDVVGELVVGELEYGFFVVLEGEELLYVVGWDCVGGCEGLIEFGVGCFEWSFCRNEEVSNCVFFNLYVVIVYFFF